MPCTVAFLAIKHLSYYLKLVITFVLKHKRLLNPKSFNLANSAAVRIIEYLEKGKIVS